MPSVWILIVFTITVLLLLSVLIGATVVIFAQYYRGRARTRESTKKTEELPVVRWPSLWTGPRTGRPEWFGHSPLADAKCVTVQPRTYEDLQKSEEQLAESTGSSERVEERRAKLKFTLHYNTVETILMVKLLQAKNLSTLRENLPSDVTYYVTLKILPLSHRSFQSRTVKGINRNTNFEDLFEFSVEEEELQKQNLKFTVCCFDRFSHHDNIGELRVSLCDLEHRGLSLSREVLLYREINEVQQLEQRLGEVMVSLGYLRLTERLAVVVISARNLPLVGPGKRPDPYIKVVLYHDRRVLRHRKTKVQMHECNPVFNDSLTFHIPQGILHQTSILICIMHDAGGDPGDNPVIGQVLLGPETTGIQFEHWNDMRVNNKPIARWHKIQPA